MSQIKSSINEHGIPYPWTQGIWTPEPNKPEYEESVKMYKMAILAVDGFGRPKIVGFAFGDDEATCLANAYVMSTSKELLHNLQTIVRPPGQFPSIEEGKKIYARSVASIEKALTPFMKQNGIIITPQSES